jgi:hypothetical protein
MRNQRKYQVLPFIQDKALTTKDMEMTHLGCATVQQLVEGSLLVNPEVDPVRHVARGIDRLSPEPSWSPMLVEHHPSHHAQGSVFPFHHTILGRCIRTRTGVQDPNHGKFRAIVCADRSYGISVPLIP